MFKLYNRLRSRRGVSPVIAVVLLIALTVAAVAVIWGITSGFLGGSDANVQYSNVNYTNSTATLTVNLESSLEATITSANVVGESITVNSTVPDTLTANNEITVTFTFSAGLPTGSYELAVSLSVDGNTQIENIAFNV